MDTPVQVTATKAPPVLRPFIFLIIGLVVVVGVVGGIVLTFSSAWAMRGIAVFEGDYVSGTYKEFGWTGLTEKTLAQDVSDVARAGEHLAAIVTSSDGQDVMLLAPEVRMLTENGTRKAALALSADGSYVAYAELTNAEEGVYFTPELSAWTIKLHDLDTGTSLSLGTGFAPHIITRDGATYVLFTSPTGIVVADAQTGATHTTFQVNGGLIDYVAHVSADGKYLAMANPITLKTDVFTLTRLSAPIGLIPLGSTEKPFVSVGFHNGALFGVERTGGTTTLWKLDPEFPSADGTAYRLPSDTLYRIIP